VSPWGKIRFTVWCWTAQGVYFALALASSLGVALPQPLICLQWILFEVSLAMALLVTIIVTFVLVPVGIKRGHPVHFMFTWYVLAMHNGNTLLMILELVLNRFDIHAYHYPTVLAYGILYVLFAWANERYGVGAFYYFFLDYTRPYALFAYLGLFAAVSVFYWMAFWIDVLFESYRVIGWVLVPASNAIMLWRMPEKK